MVNLFRRFQQPLLVGLTVMTILAFVVLYNLPGTRNGSFRSDAVGAIYGRNVSVPEYQRAGRRFEVCRELQLMELLGGLTAEARSLNQAGELYVWNTIVLRHEAAALGIMSLNPQGEERQALNKDVFERIQKIPIFQRSGGFDFTLYDAYLKNRLGSSGMTAADLEEIVMDEIRLQKIRAVIGSTVAATEAEAKSEWAERFQKMAVSLVRLNTADFQAAAQVSDEEVAKLYESRKATLKSAEKRKVRYVTFALAKEGAPPMGPLRSEAMQKLMEGAQSFADKMTAPGADFAALAADAKAPIKETALFEEAQPPADLPGGVNAAQAAFKLTPKDPNSDVLRDSSGYYVLQLTGVEESHPLTLDEAKAQLTQQLRDEKAQEAMNLRAADVRTRLETGVKGGQTFAQAAEAAGVKIETMPSISVMDRTLQRNPDGMAILSRAMELAPGQISEFVPTMSGGIIEHLDQRLPLDEEAFGKQKEQLLDNVLQQKREEIFQDWLRVRIKAANYVPKFGSA